MRSNILLQHKTFIFLIVSVVALLVLAVFLFPSFYNKDTVAQVPNSSSPDLSCVSRAEEKIVRGNSLAGVIEPGATVTLLFGYYDCNPVKLGDVVAYSYSGNSEPLVKIVKGVSGDAFGVKQDDGVWRLLINGELVKNAQGELYNLDERAFLLLSLYVVDYNGKIPVDTFLLLGNLPNGSVDSTHFGLVDKTDIVAKVE